MIPNIIFRCSCHFNPVLAELRGGKIYIKKRESYILADSPIYLSCGSCGQWYELTNKGMMKKTQQEIDSQLGHECISCGYRFFSRSFKEKCPKCGKVQAIVSVTFKQTR